MCRRCAENYLSIIIMTRFLKISYQVANFDKYRQLTMIILINFRYTGNLVFFPDLSHFQAFQGWGENYPKWG